MKTMYYIRIKLINCEWTQNINNRLVSSRKGLLNLDTGRDAQIWKLKTTVCCYNPDPPSRPLPADKVYNQSGLFLPLQLQLLTFPKPQTS